jgi:hypothetical protein
MALCRVHGVMSWAMIDQDVDHAFKWRISVIPQEILLEYENIQGWPRQRSDIGFYIGQHIKHRKCVIWDHQSCGMVRFMN